jgi:AraC-like DNA-binding protein/quercetin dioxygenase-like cupin family protein
MIRCETGGKWIMKKYDITYFDVHIPLQKEFPIDVFDWKVSRDEINCLHHHDCFEIGICYAGYGLYLIDGKIHTYQEGDLVILGPNVYHRAHAESKDADLWTFISFRPKDWGPIDLSDNLQLVIPKESDVILYQMIHQMNEEVKKNPLDKRYIVRGLMSAIIPYIKREYNLQQQKKKRKKDTEKLSYLDTRIENALNILLSKASGSDISIAELASMCNTSVSNFRAVFHEQVGMSPKKFQIELKLKKAMSLIRFSQLRIMDISYECGFNSISNFNRQFFSRYGISPSQVRKNKY